MPVRTDAELQAAVDSMFRIRAVESPPDATGAREIWHQGAKGAELVSWVDAEGCVTRHELCVFEDVLVWERGGGVKTGALDRARVSGAKPADLVNYDVGLPPRAERLGRLAKALQGYAGEDRFILHARRIVETARELGDPVPGGAITRPSIVISDELRRLAAARASGRPRSRLLVIGAGVLAALAALVLLLLK